MGPRVGIMTFTVAIIGRPNVGKSTLFNRLVGKRLALVDDKPGVTRDRREGMARLGDLRFRVIDTAGLEEAASPDALEARMRQQTDRAIAEADIALLLIDSRAGVTPVDEHFANLLRRAVTPVILVANKCEGRSGESGLYDAFALGLGEPVPISAEHGEGMADLYAAIQPHADAAAAPQSPLREDDEPVGAPVATDDEEGLPAGPLQLAIVGRPNVGKSTLVNRLLGEERMLTGPEAGITRDAIGVDWVYDGRPVKMFDTAGLRRRARIDEKLERLSGADTERAVRFAQVVVLVLDATVMLEKQDLTIARRVIEEGRALVIAANKWDLVSDRRAAMDALRDRLETSLPQVRGIPVVTVSALSGEGMDRIMHAVFDIFAIWNSRVPTARLNQWLATMIDAHAPPLVGGRRLKLRYMTQVKSRPPSFAIWTTRPDDLPEAYLRYLIHGLRDAFGMEGVPIRIGMRQSKNPYAPKD